MAKDKSTNSKVVEKRGVAAWQSALERFDRLFEAAGHEAVFAEPVAAEGATVISAAEVMIGIGGGGGGSFSLDESQAVVDQKPDEEGGRTTDSDDFGGGGGGGAYSRPVAIIIIDRDGVRVKPIYDATKVALAGITAFGSMLFMLARMWRASNAGRE
jgi:uncharacterized spore protein YtfJ